jgi:RHS repeat-associated protein
MRYIAHSASIALITIFCISIPVPTGQSSESAEVQSAFVSEDHGGVNSIEMVDTLEDDVPDFTPIPDLSQMFNERGYMNSNGFSLDESEIVNDYNGNLIYEIPLFNSAMPQNMKYDVKLTYNGSVNHVINIGDTSTYNNGSASKYNLNSPEWILSVNDIAVQVFNFEIHFFTEPPQSGNQISGDDIHKLIPGYHYCDRLTPGETGNHDRIHILAGDGSFITMVNTNSSDTGDYVYEGKELYYKARVSYAEVPGYQWYTNRKMELMKGDGNVFVFYEYKPDFEDYDRNSVYHAAKKPQLFLLNRIIDQFGNEIVIEYGEWIPSGSSGSGRPLCTSIASKPSTIGISMIYGSAWSKITSGSDVNKSYQLYYKNPVAFNPNSQLKNRTGYIDTIKNCINEKMIIGYEGSSDYTRILAGVVNPISAGTLDLNFTNLKRMKSFRNYLGGIRSYNYFPVNSHSIQIDVGYFAQGSNGPIRSSQFKGQGRDPFFSNMLHSRTDTNLVAKSYTEYGFGFTDVNVNFNQLPLDTSDIYTSSTYVANLDNSTINSSNSSRTSTRSYRTYPINDFSTQYLDNVDIASTIKLMSSKVENSSTAILTVDTFYYDQRNFTSLGYDGSFLIKTQKSYYGDIGRLWRYEYTFFGGNSYDTNLPQTRTVIDPLNNKTKTMIDSFYTLVNVQYSEDDIYCYQVGLPLEEMKLDQNNNILQRIVYSYYHDTVETNKGYYGQLYKEALLNTQSSSDSLVTNYEYYRHDTTGYKLYGNDLPEKEGQLRLLKKPNGEEERYFFNIEYLSNEFVQPGGIEEATAPMLIYKVKYSNGTIVPDTVRLPRYGIRPVRIDRYKRYQYGTADTLGRNYYFYNSEGLLTERIDFNRFLSAISYQPLNRVNSVTLPGDFSTQPNDTTEVILPLTLTDTLIINSTNWGYIDEAIGNYGYIYYNNQSITTPCNYFKMEYKNINGYSKHRSLFLMDGQNLPPFRGISFAELRLGIYRTHQLVADIPNNSDVSIILNPVDSEASLDTIGYCPNYSSIKYQKDIYFLSSKKTEINVAGGDSVSCNYTINEINVTNFLNDFISVEGRSFIGFSIYPTFTFVANGSPTYDVKQQYFCEIAGQTFENWRENYSPRLTVAGEMDFSDTVRIPHTYGGTIIYEYDDPNNSVTIRSRLTEGADFSDFKKINYSFDGFANIVRKDVFVSQSDSNSYRYQFNFLNKPARNFDARNDSTMFSHDGLERLIRTKNSDISSSENSFAYYDNMSNYFGGTFSGFVEKQTYTDEEGNQFEKYFDAVGNLRRERKFVDASTVGDDPPGYLTTDYRYDSLYRLTKVKTPQGKIIYYAYDGFGRQSARNTPDAGQTDFIYDKNNNLTYSQDENQKNVNDGKYTFRNYDGLNRITGTGENIFTDDSPGNGNQFESSDPQYYLTVNAYDTIEEPIVDIFAPPNGYYDLPNYTKGRLVATAFRTRQSDNWSYKYYRYDERGRVKTMWQMIDGLDVKTVSHEYNSQDMVKSLNYNIGVDFKRYRYRYDSAGRLLAVDTYEGPETTDDPTYYETFTDYAYNPNSAIESQNFLTGFTGTTLGYDNRGRITSYYSHNSEFIYNLSYLKNSNVLQQELYGSYRDYFANTEDLVYKFTYDKSKRLLSATNTAGSSNEYAVENTYDKDGNIITLKRYGDAGVMQDDFAYQYYSGTNKLRKVAGSADQYQYDLNGNLATDSLNKNTSAVYDHRNLLIEIYHKRGTPPARIDYFATRYYYDESGNRVRKLTYKNNNESAGPVLDWNNTSNPGNNWTLFNNEHYARGVDGKELATYTNNSLEEWYVWGTDMVGKIKGNTKYYFFKDHLGSVRGVIDNSFNLISAQDFDTWGYLLENKSYNADSTKHKFTGKERDAENLYDYFGARYYDSRIGRFPQIDPLANTEPSKTPYHYTSDNPINRIDPQGLDDIYYKDGEEVGRRVSGLWDFDWLFGDTYYVQSESGSVEYEGSYYFEALSEATVKQFEGWDRVLSNWESSTTKEGFVFRLSESIKDAPSDQVSRYNYAREESPTGNKLDQKRFLQKYSIYVFNNIAMNYEEAGNAIFGAAINLLGINLDIANIAGHAYSIGANKRLDEFNEVQAYTIGYYNFNSVSQYFRNRHTQPFR